MSSDKDNTTRKHTLKVGVDIFKLRELSSTGACVVCLRPKIELECRMSFHTCNHSYNSPTADPGSHAAVVPKLYYKQSKCH